jgi:hypothetical protein
MAIMMLLVVVVTYGVVKLDLMLQEIVDVRDIIVQMDFV